MIHPSRETAASFADLSIGLLGGSFNPAHGGHLEMSLFAKRRLCLDQVWWLVSPQNPLKKRDGMAPLDERLAGAAALVAPYKDVVATAIERELGTAYTCDTLRVLRDIFTQTRFVWLMGSDNFAEIPLWRNWEEIFRLVPIAVFNRRGYDNGSNSCSKTHASVAYAQRALTDADRLAQLPPPAWLVLDNLTNGMSATEIRKTRNPL